MLAIAFTILIGSTLLFLIEPAIAKYILPWFGGGPSVWSTCMLFFQVFLLGGYTYAHVSGQRLKPRRQALVHLGLLALSLAWLPMTPTLRWKPVDPTHPEWRIILLLTMTIGLPFALLSSTSPLHMNWFNRTQPGRSPWRLYALSNVGSVLGLLAYPFLLEPLLPLKAQTYLLSGIYGLFAIMSGWCALRLYRQAQPEEDAGRMPAPRAEHTRLGVFKPAAWLIFSACGSIMLLATTNQMCQEVAVIPFLWIIPLAIYLASFILTFESERWYKRWIWGPVLVAAGGGVLWQFNTTDTVYILLQIGILSATLLACCMVCHGELVRLKPHADHLTAFYLLVSLGGALGGIIVNFAAPRIFSGFWEFHIGLVLVFILFGIEAARGKMLGGYYGRVAFVPLWLACLAAVIFYLQKDYHDRNENTIDNSRNFYGVLSVSDWTTGYGDRVRSLWHGPIEHGNEFLDEERRDVATTYYSPYSGVGLACRFHPRRKEIKDGAGLNIAIVGLGTGTSACLGSRGDALRFYEINSEIRRIARQHFHFLEDCKAQWQIVMGDARVSLERELAVKPEGNQFDVLALDAFNGDSPPVHLLTREACAMYWRHLRPDGILAVNISNLHVDLAPVVLAQAQAAGKQMIVVTNQEDAEGAYLTDWALVTSNQAFLNHPDVKRLGDAGWEDARTVMWTDQYSNIVSLLYPLQLDTPADVSEGEED